MVHYIMSTVAATQEPRPSNFFRIIDDAITPIRKSVKRFTIIHSGFIGAKEYLNNGAIDENLYTWISASKLLSGLTFILSIPKFITNIQFAYRADSPVEKIERVASALITAGAMTGGAATLIDALRELKYLPSTSFGWAHLVSGIFLPLQVISLELNASRISESHTLKNEIFTVLHRIETKHPRSKQIKNLTQCCNYIIENKRDLEKSLVISKKEQLDIKAKEVIKDLKSRNKARSNQAIANGELLLDILKNRASTKYNLSLAAGITKAFALTVAAISLVFLSIPIGWIAMATVTSVSLTVFATEKLLMHKHPFSVRAI
jgi:hypothetical protein